MAIENLASEPYNEPNLPMEVELAEEDIGMEEGVDILPDGSAEITLDDAPEQAPPMEFASNLAEMLDDNELLSIGSDVRESFDRDMSSRKDWAHSYARGLRSLGLNVETRTQPFEGACGVVHPILLEAAIRFQAHIIGEIFPADGPVKKKIVGQETPEVHAQAGRVSDYINYLLTEELDDYRDDTELLLFGMPLSGDAFKKVYFDPDTESVCAEYVPSENVIVNYGARSLKKAERITHVIPNIGENSFKRRQASGFYRNVDVSSGLPYVGDVQKEIDRLNGEQQSGLEEGYTLLEQHVFLELEIDDEISGGKPLPYIVTTSYGSNEVLSIYRNWLEEDVAQSRRPTFVHYRYVPGFGFYGIGLTHMIGGIAQGSTSILRQLVDAGTLATLPGGFVAKDLEIEGENTPIEPGEWRPVRTIGMSLKDGMVPLPYKEPSGVLYNLFNTIVEEGRRFASLNDINASDMNQQAPVGTTLAILERSMKVLSSVQARTHASVRKELKLISRVIGENPPEKYPYDLGQFTGAIAQDFDGRVDVLPVSDPNSTTMAQRVMQMQSVQQLATSNPELYDIRALHMQFLGVLGVQNVEQIMPDKSNVERYDPVTENMRILNGEAVMAFLEEDHDAHIDVHMGAINSPQLAGMVEQSPNAESIMGAASAHVMQHVAFQYRKEVEDQLGTPMPPPDQPMPPEIEAQFSSLVAKAAERAMQKTAQEEQEKKDKEIAEDPIHQLQKQEADAKQASLEARAENDRMKVELDRMKLSLQAEKQGQDIGIKILELQKELEVSGAQIESAEVIENARLLQQTIANQIGNKEPSDD